MVEIKKPKITIEAVKQHGYLAAIASLPACLNPYHVWPDLRDAWHEGYQSWKAP